MKHLVMIMAAVLFIGALGACSNTFHGAGEDLENAGESVQNAVPEKR